MVGTFMPARSGSRIDYRIEFIPRALLEVGIAFLVSTPILAVLVASRYVALSEASSLFVIVPLVLAANIWISERQAQWLKAFVIGELEAGPSV